MVLKNGDFPDDAPTGKRFSSGDGAGRYCISFVLGLTPKGNGLSERYREVALL